MSENKKALFAYLAVCLFWGSTYLAIRIGVRDFPPSLFASFRFLVAGSVMLSIVYIKKLKFPSQRKIIMKQSIVGLFMLLGGTGFVYHAEKTLQSSIASLIISTVPLFIAVLEIVILRKKKMSKVGVFGLIIGFAGVAYLALSGGETLIFDPKGMILTLFASLFWSIGSVFAKSIDSDGHIISNIGIQMLSGGIGLFILGSVTGELSQMHPSRESVIALFYLIIFGSLVAYSCYIYALDKWPASRVGTYAYVNPVVALILGVLILNEPINLSIVFSMMIIITGVILVQKSKIDDVKQP